MTTLRQILKLIQKTTARYELVIWFEDKKCVHRSNCINDLYDWVTYYPSRHNYRIVTRWTI